MMVVACMKITFYFHSGRSRNGVLDISLDGPLPAGQSVDLDSYFGRLGEGSSVSQHHREKRGLAGQKGPRHLVNLMP